MAKAKKKKRGNRPGDAAKRQDPLLYEISIATEQGDNRRARAAARAALEDVDASPEAKEAALAVLQRLSYDKVALALAGGCALAWSVILFFFVIGRG